MRLLASVFALLLTASAGGCRPPAVAPPYAEGRAPAPAVLLAATAPKVSALQVSSAKVRVGRAPAGNLMFLAQKPGRFSGQIQVAGHEFLSLAFHEQGYTLRNIAAENLPDGFYKGPPADCAIPRLIGVRFSAEELVALVLGGAPVIAPPYEVVEQRWDARNGHELLRLRTAISEQELRFAFVDGAWWMAGGTLWHRRGDGSLQRLWTIAHEDLQRVEATVLPGRTRISRPGERREERVVITYASRQVDPDLGDAAAAAGDDDGGWEDEDTAGEPAASEPAAGEAAAGEAAGETAPAPAPALAQIPPQFTLDGAGLTFRGDLCRQLHSARGP